MGPTASGKSAIALQLAQRLPVEIVSVDSAQVFRGMDVGTAKPSREERARVPHHLIDIIEPTDSYSAARFCQDAATLVESISARGRLPLLVGGTMLYFKALREGLSALPGAAPELRAQIEAEAAASGWPQMHAQLARVDPATAAHIEPNDSQRIQRALEVFRSSGVTMSSLIAESRIEPAPVRWLQIALVPSLRSVLHERIAARFASMLTAGLVEELAALRERHALNAALPSMRCVGYRQAWEYLEGRIDRAALRDRGIFATRQLAKRQLTWLRSMQGLEVVDCLAQEPAGAVLALIEREMRR